MEQADKSKFIEKIKTMLFVIDGTHAPQKATIGAYALALKQFTIEEVIAAIDLLTSSTNGHITPFDIIQQIKGTPIKLSESENRSAAAADLSKAHWVRAGYPSADAYEKHNHEIWLKEQEKLK